jgi:hypothetical protein
MDMGTGTEIRPSACYFGNVEAARKNACMTAAVDGCKELIELPTAGSTP